jgi:hypothetical protein
LLSPLSILSRGAALSISSIQKIERSFCAAAERRSGEPLDSTQARGLNALKADSISGGNRLSRDFQSMVADEVLDSSEAELRIGFGVIEIQGRAAGGTLVFAGEDEEPLLGMTVLESAGFWIDPQRERLVPPPPKRKRGGKKR